MDGFLEQMQMMLLTKDIELKDDAGLYYIKNSAASNGALPEHTLLVQQDSTGKPLTQLKMDVLNRKFE
jgi:hypothetical protein